MDDSTKPSDDVVDSSQFQLDLQLRCKKLLRYLLYMTFFHVAFSITFYMGIPIATVYEAIGTSSVSEELMETYNTYSGYFMALVEVALSMYMDTFLPVLKVYVHNRLFFLQRDAEGKPRTTSYRRLHTVLLLLLPAVLVLTNSSVKSLQAVQFTTGIRRIVTVDDLKKETSVLELLKSKRERLKMSAKQTTASDTILKNAIRQKATPFTFDTKSPCGRTAKGDTPAVADVWKPKAQDLASTSAIYGFAPREWNSEAMATVPASTSTYTVSYQQAADARRTNVSLPRPANFSLQTAYEMLVQAKMVIERAVGNSVTGSYRCSLSDGLTDKALSLSLSQSSASLTDREVFFDEDDLKNQWTYDADGVRQCEGGVSSMLRMGDFYNRKVFTAEDLVADAARIIGVTIPAIAHEETQIKLETYDLTPQIRLETMQIDLVLNTSIDYGLGTSCPDSDPDCEMLFAYGPFQNVLCGSNSCAFVDASGWFPAQPEIAVLPYYTNCTLGPGQVHYSADFRGFYPDECTRSRNSTFLYGYGSYMTGKEFGSYDPVQNSSYIVAPRRRISFVFSKVVWTLEDLAKIYGATCDNSTQDPKVNCSGLSYQLQPSGRFLFAGKAALPTGALKVTSFRSPIPLVQLNSPSFGFDSVIERLVPVNFEKTLWPGKAIYNNSALGGGECSMLIDSYLKHVNDNNYFLERPLQVMYTSFFYFLMQDAAVTELNDTSVALDERRAEQILMKDRLGNARLKGDEQLRSIRVSIPLTSFLTTLTGCICIFIATIVIVGVPARHVKYFAEGTTKAEQFVAMRKDADYPDDVHNKLVRIPETRDTVRFQDLEIEALALTHVSTLSKCTAKYCQSKDQEEASESESESESDVSQAATSEDPKG